MGKSRLHTGAYLERPHQKSRILDCELETASAEPAAILISLQWEPGRLFIIMRVEEREMLAFVITESFQVGTGRARVIIRGEWGGVIAAAATGMVYKGVRSGKNGAEATDP